MHPLSYIWAWFLDIFLVGGYGMGPFRTPFTEIEAYSRMMGIRIEGWEAKVIRDLAGAYMRNEIKKSRNPNLTNVTPMTDSEGLKAMFKNVGNHKPKKGAPNGLGGTGPKG